MEQNPFKFTKKLLSDLKKDSISDTLYKEIEEVINTKPSIKALYDELQNKDEISSQLSIMTSFDIESAYKKIHKPHKNNKYKLILKIAAIIVTIAISIPFLFLETENASYNAELIGSGKTVIKASDGRIVSLDTVFNIGLSNNLFIQNEKGILVINENFDTKTNNTNGTNAIEVPYKGLYKIVLPDGTKVSLNSGSTLRFPDHFASGERIVELKGEAFFDVTKSDGHPFIVKTDNISIKVLGTKFNVKSYENESSTYTTLLEGKIELLSNNEEKSILPGEQVVFEKATKELEIKQIDTEPITAWTDNMFHFNNTPLDEIMKSLSRWYGVEIRYENNSADIKNTVYSGKVKMYTHPEDVLRKFEKTGGIEFELKNNTIIISKKS